MLLIIKLAMARRAMQFGTLLVFPAKFALAGGASGKMYRN
jgi:hypothetical protein